MPHVMSPLTVDRHDSTPPIGGGILTPDHDNNHGRVAHPNGCSSTHWESTTPMDAQYAALIGPTLQNVR